MVVINGPVASAGSIFILFSNKGITVPKKEAKMITINRAIETVKVRFRFPDVKKL